MIVQPYSNLTLDLAAVTMIMFYKNPQQSQYMNCEINGQKTNINFDPHKVEEIYAAIAAFNDNRGNYYRLFHNVYLNLNKVSMVVCLNNRIQVHHDAGVWVSDASKNAMEIYKGYADHVARQQHAKMELATLPPRPKARKQSVRVAPAPKIK